MKRATLGPVVAIRVCPCCPPAIYLEPAEAFRQLAVALELAPDFWVARELHDRLEEIGGCSCGARFYSHDELYEHIEREDC